MISTCPLMLKMKRRVLITEGGARNSLHHPLTCRDKGRAFLVTFRSEDPHFVQCQPYRVLPYQRVMQFSLPLPHFKCHGWHRRRKALWKQPQHVLLDKLSILTKFWAYLRTFDPLLSMKKWKMCFFDHTAETSAENPWKNTPHLPL